MSKHSETGAFFMPGRRGSMIKVKSKFTINKIRIKELEQAAVTQLEETGEALHTEVVQKQVVPRDTGNL